MNNHSTTLIQDRHYKPVGTRLDFVNLQGVVRDETFWKSQKNSRNVSEGKPAIDANWVPGPKSPRHLPNKVLGVRGSNHLTI
jgi:hypothetical protein